MGYGGRLIRAGNWPVPAYLLFPFGLLERLIQLAIFWPSFAKHIAVKTFADNQPMQLLPEPMMRNHPWWGLWYLQESPPLPNIVYAAVLAVTHTPQARTVVLIVLQAVISSTTASAMALLLKRLGLGATTSIVMSVLFLLSADLLIMEYYTTGQFFYETGSMLLGVLSCHAALTLIRDSTVTAAFWLGVGVACLALTRSTFSYFWFVVLLWILMHEKARKLATIGCFLVPVFLLQGGWCFKNFIVHDYWSWSTSSWGGANMLNGQKGRGDGEAFHRWLQKHPAICENPWYQLTLSPPPYFFFMPQNWGPANALPANVVDADRMIAARRGYPAPLDSVAGQKWSACLFREVSSYWLSHPVLIAKDTWESYRLFWQPIREFAVTQPEWLIPDMPAYGSHDVTWLRAFRDSIRELSGHFKVRKRALCLCILTPAVFGPAPTVLTIPFVPSVISAGNLLVLHSLPLLLLFSWMWRVKQPWPSGFSFLVVIYAYVAGLSSIIEFGENMRFRLEVEPVIWAMCAVIVQRWAWSFRNWKVGWPDFAVTRGFAKRIRAMATRIGFIHGKYRLPYSTSLGRI